jgi:6-phosphogluconolactonase
MFMLRQQFEATRLSLIGALMMLPVGVFAAATSGWIGTYTVDEGVKTGSVGIYSFQWDSDTGLVSAVRPVATAGNPSFLALHPNGRFLYAVNEHPAPGADGSVTAYAITNASSAEPLTTLGSVSSMGQGPCHLTVDSTGKWLFVANYGSGSIAVYPIQSDGHLGEASQTIQHHGSGPVKGRQETPHAHEVVQSPDGHFLLVPDLGSDKVFVYRFDAAAGKLSANDPAAAIFPAGYGPRHLVFSRDARFVYAITELSPSVVTLSWNAQQGSLTQLSVVSTLPADFNGVRSGAEIALHPSGKFLYASNRGDSNTIAIFQIDSHGIPVAHGRVPSGGKTPRYFGIDPSGKFLITANQSSGDLFIFRIDPATGELTRQGAAVAAPGAVDFAFATAGAHP